ncbi:PREDICTED: PRUPE_2G131400 [Prunus dulcis]|uniref:PREDICTED: PRUPE_2G131400 n=1 Tax=Prunus dulcis TaxID=3755 RepID=A0A5E4EF88_PRUDU|nr:PREDICTED: PRUPE_2G131400 [Prunus dulcis]
MPLRSPKSISMEIKFKFQKVIWLCTWGKSEEESIKFSLKCLSCPAFQKETIKSQPDAFDAKIEGPFLLLSYSTTPLVAKTIASLERAAVSALLMILIRPGIFLSSCILKRIMLYRST